MDKNEVLVKALQGRAGDTHAMAFAFLVEKVERLANSIYSRPGISIGVQDTPRSGSEQRQGATRPQVVKSPWTQQPPISPYAHPNLSLVRDGVVHSPGARDPSHIRTFGRSYAPAGQYPTIKRNSSVERFLDNAPLDDQGNRIVTTTDAQGRTQPLFEPYFSTDALRQPKSAHRTYGRARASFESTYSGKRPNFERHSSTDALLTPTSGGRNSRRRGQSTAESRMASRSMGNLLGRPQERRVTMLEEMDIRKACSIGNMLNEARQPFPVSGSHTLYYEHDGDGPPLRRPPPVFDDSVVMFQGVRHRKDHVFMNGFSDDSSDHAQQRGQSSEMVQRPSRSSLQHDILKGVSRDMRARKRHGRNYSYDSSNYPSAVAEGSTPSLHRSYTDTTNTSNSIAPTRAEYYQNGYAIASSNASQPSRYRNRVEGTVTARRPVVNPQSRHFRSTSIIVAEPSLNSSQSSSPRDQRVMVSDIPAELPQSESSELLLSGSPQSLDIAAPRVLQPPTPGTSEFGGIEAVECTPVAPDPLGRPVARFESMKSSVSRNSDALVAGESTVPVVRLPPRAEAESAANVESTRLVVRLPPARAQPRGIVESMATLESTVFPDSTQLPDPTASQEEPSSSRVAIPERETGKRKLIEELD